MEIEAKVLGGLLLNVEFNKVDLEENGEFQITHINKRSLRPKYRPEWLYKRLEQSGEDQNIIQECLNEIHDSQYFN